MNLKKKNLVICFFQTSSFAKIEGHVTFLLLELESYHANIFLEWLGYVQLNVSSSLSKNSLKRAFDKKNPKYKLINPKKGKRMKI